MKMGKHSWLMMAGCGIMLAGVFILPLLGVRPGGIFPVLLLLACPLSMVFMMGSMGMGHSHSGHAASGPEADRQAPCHTEPAARALPAPSDQE